MWSSTDGEYSAKIGVRPVVSLASNIKLTKNAQGTGGV